MPRAFSVEREWPPITAALPFIGVMIGCLLAGAVNLYWSAQHYAPAVRANSGQAQPEMRLPPMLLGGVTLPIGCFWVRESNRASELKASVRVDDRCALDQPGAPAESP